MRLMTTFALCLTILLGPMATAPASAATTAEVATQVRSHWANARTAYLASAQPYQSQAAYATLVSQYTAATDKVGSSLENFIKLRLASPATPATQLTAAVDQLAKDLGALRVLSGKASGPLVNVLGTALSQQSAVTQTALANMR
jgi:hypothetical protein